MAPSIARMARRGVMLHLARGAGEVDSRRQPPAGEGPRASPHPSPLPQGGGGARSRQRFERAAAGVARLLAELLLDADELVVLREPVGAGKRPGLDLPAIRRNREV